MPTIKVPTPLYTAITGLKPKMVKFRNLGDEALALAAAEKYISVRRKELSADLYDLLEGKLPASIKTVQYGERSIDRAEVLAYLADLLPDDLAVTGADLTAKAGGPSFKLDKRALVAYDIPCTNPKCKTVNHLPAAALDDCSKRSKDDRRPSVSVKLAGELVEEE